MRTVMFFVPDKRGPRANAKSQTEPGRLARDYFRLDVATTGRRNCSLARSQEIYDPVAARHQVAPDAIQNFIKSCRRVLKIQGERKHGDQIHRPGQSEFSVVAHCECNRQSASAAHSNTKHMGRTIHGGDRDTPPPGEVACEQAGSAPEICCAGKANPVFRHTSFEHALYLHKLTAADEAIIVDSQPAIRGRDAVAHDHTPIPFRPGPAGAVPPCSRLSGMTVSPTIQKSFAPELFSSTMAACTQFDERRASSGNL